MIHKRVVPESAVSKKLSKSKEVNTLAGKLHVSDMVVLRDVRLPEFDKNRKIESHRALIFDQPCWYDMILGIDFLRKVGIDIGYKKELHGMVWQYHSPERSLEIQGL